jgi:DNA-binding NtrC family response regulator
LGKAVTRISDAALMMLTRYDWPGNVRELQNVIERAVVLSSDDAIAPADLPDELWLGGRESLPAAKAPPMTKALPAPGGGGRLRRGVAVRPKPASVARRVAVSSSDADEREQLVAALKEAEGNKAEAARLMGLPRSTFFSKLKKYGLG